MKKLFLLLFAATLCFITRAQVQPIPFGGPIEIKLKNPGPAWYVINKTTSDTLMCGYGADSVFTFTNNHGDICFNLAGTIKCISEIGSANYVAGEGISINGNTISNTSQGTLYAAGSGLILTGTTFSWGVARNSTLNQAGAGLTIPSGGAKAGSLNTGSAPLIFEAPATTGNSTTAIKFQGRDRSSTTSTADNALYDEMVLLGRDRIVNNTNDTIFSVTLTDDSCYTGLIAYNLMIQNSTTTVTKSGFYQFTAIKVSGVWSGSFSELTMTVNLFGSTLTSTPTILFKHSPRRAYMLINYNSNLSSITKMKLGLAIVSQMGGGTTTTQY